VPHYNTLSRRQQGLTVVIPYRSRSESLHLIVDSAGLKVLGEGEWKVRRHGADRRRVGRKVHLAVDADNHEVRAVEMTDHRHGDGEILPSLLTQVPTMSGSPTSAATGPTTPARPTRPQRPATQPCSCHPGATANHGRR
jgi:hypothetical protein